MFLAQDDMIVQFHPHQTDGLLQLAGQADVRLAGRGITGGMVMCQNDVLGPDEQPAAQQESRVQVGCVKFAGTDQAKADGLELVIEVQCSHLLLDVDHLFIPGMVEEFGSILTVLDSDGIGGETVPDTELGQRPAGYSSW